MSSEIFVTPVLRSTPAKSPSRARTNTAFASRKRLDTYYPKQLTEEQAKVGTLVAGAESPRDKDRGMIIAVKDGACSIIWNSDGAAENMDIEDLTLFEFTAATS